MSYVPPADLAQSMIEAGQSKVLMSTRDTLIRAFMGGAILALAAAFAITVSTQTGQPLLGAVLFPVGFILLYLLGFDLLTGVFTLAPMALIDKRPGINLELVRGAQAPIAQLEAHGHADGVEHAVAAPGRPHARLHRAQRLAVRVARLEARVDEALPDERQLLEPRAEHVDPLPAGDLRVQAEVLRHLPDRDEPLGRDLAARHARHDRRGSGPRSTP